MQNALDNLLTQLAGLLGPLSPFTKAVVPAALAVAVAVVKCIFDGAVDAVSLTIAVSGLVLAVAVYLLPNRAHVPPHVAPPVRPAK